MSRNTMSFALPEAMRHDIDARVASGHYGNTSEYIRDLIAQGLASGPAEARTDDDLNELRAIARGERT